MKNHIHRVARGFSLLEVLIAVVILSFGLLALATLQLSLFKSSAASKAQSVALSLAKDKIESMRSFTTLDNYINNIIDVAATNTAVGGVTYAMSTDVKRYVFGKSGTNPGAFLSVGDTTPEATLKASTDPVYIVGRDFKRVQVKVTWTESTGDTRTLTLEDVIDGLDPADSAKIVKNSSSAKPRNVQVIINNPANEAGVIPIAIGDTTDTAATNPRPVVNESATETRFDIYTYSALTDNNNLAAAQSRVETNIIGCTCDTANAPTDTTERGYRPTYWNGTRYVAPTLTTYRPDAGQATVSKKGTAESPYCTICCRDHEDPASLNAGQPRFDPWRSTHTHYGLDNSNTLVAVGGSQTTYLEACRLIRVDGIYRVATDPRDDYFDLLATKNDGSTTEYAPTTAAVDNYQTFVLDYLDKKVVSNNTPGTYNNRVASADVATLVGNNAPNTTSTSIDYPDSIALQRSGDHKYLHSRGLYLDYLEPEALGAIASAKQNCVNSGCSASEKQSAVLSLLPFTSINLTELADWTPIVSDNDHISVSNGGFSTAASSDFPVRGYTVPNQLDNNAQTATATTAMRDSTSGLQVLYDTYIDADERDDASAHLSDTQEFSIPAGGSSGNNNGTFKVAFSGYDFGATPQLSGTNITQCTRDKGNGNSYLNTYTCSASSTPISPMALKVQSYNYQADETGLSITCSGPSGNVTYVTTKQDTALTTCKKYSLTKVTSDAASVTVTGPTPFNTGSVGEYSDSTISPVSNGDTLTLTFTGPTTTLAGYTCTYTIGNGNKKNYIITNNLATCP